VDMVYLFIFSESCVRLMHTISVLYEGSGVLLVYTFWAIGQIL